MAHKHSLLHSAGTTVLIVPSLQVTNWATRSDILAACNSHSKLHDVLQLVRDRNMLHVLIIQLYLHTCAEATHRQYSEGCLLPHVPSFPCNSHRHRRAVVRLLLSPCPSDKSSMSLRSGNSLFLPHALPTACSSVLHALSTSNAVYLRISSVKLCLPNTSSSVGHMPKSTKLSLRFSLWGQRSSWRREPGDEAICETHGGYRSFQCWELKNQCWL